jgi:NAD(P)-dependent dehydrogenase (short-subunit alcohol dehydrogenase family)
MKGTAIITGSRRGIGRAIARRLSADGFKVLLNGTHGEADLSDIAGPSAYVEADVSTAEGRQKILDTALNCFGSVELLVNNAGVAPKERADLLEMSEESWDYVLDTNAKSNMFMSQLVAKQMLSQKLLSHSMIDQCPPPKRGTIINISSCSSVVSSVNRGEYCVSKAAISMLTRVFADRLAAEGILVYEVRPGVIATDMTAGVRAKYDALIERGDFPLKRWGEGEDIAAAVSAFAADYFNYTTGNYIDVDGGFHIRRL